MARVGPQSHKKKKIYVQLKTSTFPHAMHYCVLYAKLLTEYTEIISVYRINLCLGALAKLRKGPDSCLHHVCPSVCCMLEVRCG